MVETNSFVVLTLSVPSTTSSGVCYLVFEKMNRSLNRSQYPCLGVVVPLTLQVQMSRVDAVLFR
jgi:hypothetical protein